jgi:integrase/recombinase XerD
MPFEATTGLSLIDDQKITQNHDISRHFTTFFQNHRLATLHAFFGYVQAEEPAHILQCQKILAIPLRRHVRPLVDYLSKEELAEILAQPDVQTSEGRRDAVLLSVLYDTGARVQELIDLRGQRGGGKRVRPRDRLNAISAWRIAAR